MSDERQVSAQRVEPGPPSPWLVDHGGPARIANVDLRRFWVTLYKRRWLIAAATVAVVLVTGLARALRSQDVYGIGEDPHRPRHADPQQLERHRVADGRRLLLSDRIRDPAGQGTRRARHRLAQALRRSAVHEPSRGSRRRGRRARLRGARLAGIEAAPVVVGLAACGRAGSSTAGDDRLRQPCRGVGRDLPLRPDDQPDRELEARHDHLLEHVPGALRGDRRRARQAVHSHQPRGARRLELRGAEDPRKAARRGAQALRGIGSQAERVPPRASRARGRRQREGERRARAALRADQRLRQGAVGAHRGGIGLHARQEAALRPARQRAARSELQRVEGSARAGSRRVRSAAADLQADLSEDGRALGADLAPRGAHRRADPQECGRSRVTVFGRQGEGGRPRRGDREAAQGGPRRQRSRRRVPGLCTARPRPTASSTRTW